MLEFACCLPKPFHFFGFVLLRKKHITLTLARGPKQCVAQGWEDYRVTTSTCARSMFWVLCKIHISGSSTRSMCQDPLQDPCLWILYRALVQDPCHSDVRQPKHRDGCADILKTDTVPQFDTHELHGRTALQRERFDAREARKGLRGNNWSHSQKLPKGCAGTAKIDAVWQWERAKTREFRRGLCFQTWTGTTPQPDKNYQKKFRPHLAVNIEDPNSTAVSQNERFEPSEGDCKSTKYCACHENDYLQFQSISGSPCNGFARPGFYTVNPSVCNTVWGNARTKH